MCYHVLNRGNARGEVFHKNDDYAAFLKLLVQSCERGFAKGDILLLRLLDPLSISLSIFSDFLV